MGTLTSNMETRPIRVEDHTCRAKAGQVVWVHLGLDDGPGPRSQPEALEGAGVNTVIARELGMAQSSVYRLLREAGTTHASLKRSPQPRAAEPTPSTRMTSRL